MAQFVKNGPDIPNDFLQAHESGKVVFFCGAGISRPHLPGFDGLVQKLFDRFGIPEGGKGAKKQERYEVAVELLDKTIAGGRDGGRVRIREEINHILTPNKDSRPTIHRSLLDLATSKGKTRLITTNFDRFFERAIGDEPIKRYLPPALPVPKRKWSGVVYLHGRLPENGENGMDDMVISSADFGRAYILEQWAANFVRDLFRNHSVCFVGYGINDPVMRYLMDALAADGLSGASDKEIYAFAGHDTDKKDAVHNEWKNKGVTPILYSKKDKNDHTPLHDTLHEWANVYTQGTEGKKAIINRHVKLPPPKSDKGFVAGQMLWATTDTIAAKHFANLNPVPPFGWIKVFGDKCKRLVSRGNNGDIGKLDDEVLPMAEWLLRPLHLENPVLVRWFAQQGGKLHNTFASMLGFRIKNIESSPMRTLWDLLLSGRIGESDIFDTYDWEETLRRAGPSFAVRSQLRDMLSPRISVGNTMPSHSNPQHISDIIDCHINLRWESASSAMYIIKNDSRWQELLPLMLDDFTVLLRDTMDLMREVGKADDKYDNSYLSLSSIAKHQQNRYPREWILPAKLARDAWMATKETNLTKALRVAEDWQRTPYPIFKRLAFFAAAQDDIIPKQKALNWLLADDGWWLWTPETKRESIRLMVALAPKFNAKEACKLTSAILKRPPREMYLPSATDENFDHAVWLRLAKAQAADIMLDKAAQSELDRLTGKYPWKIAEDERDEFFSWSSGVVHVGDNLPPEYVHPPKTSPELAEWLKNEPTSGWYSDYGTWRGYCANRCEVVITALEILAKQNTYPTERWSGALSAWSRGELLQKSWQVAPTLAKADDDLLQKTVHSMAFWLHEQGEKLPEEDGALFLRLIRRVIVLRQKPDDADTDDKSLLRMLDSPVAMVTEGLMLWLFRQNKPKLSGDIRRLMTYLCNTAKSEYRPVRSVLATRAWDFFRIDEKWTRKNLLPLFDWQKPEADAIAAWHGFLSSPSPFFPVLTEIKHSFLQTVEHYKELKELGNVARQYVEGLTMLALYSNKEKLFSPKKLRATTTLLPDTGLYIAADIIRYEIASKGEHRGKFWRKSVSPYFRRVWPELQEKVTENTALRIARICTETGEEFANAVQQLKYFLIPLNNPNDAYHGLSEYGLCEKFPEASLFFLDTITSDTPAYWILKQLRKFLDEIQQADSQLADTPEYIRLNKICQKYGF